MSLENSILDQELSMINEEKANKIQPDIKKPLSIDQALEHVGTSGYYQKRMLLNFTLQYFWAAILFISQPFLFIPPNFICNENRICTETNGGCLHQIKDPKSKMSISNEFQLYCGKNISLRSFGEAMIFFGSIFGVFIFNIYSIQRKKGMILTTVSSGIAAMFFAFSTNYQMAYACLFFIGFSSNFNVLHLSFLSEQTGHHFRQRGVAIMFMGWSVMSLLLGLIGYVIDNWRTYAFIFMGLVGLVLIVCNIFLLESPKFMYLSNKPEALKILNQIAHLNEKPKLNLNEIEDLTEEQLKVNREKFNYYLWDLFRYKSLRYKMIIAICLFFFLSLGYYGSVIATNEVGLNVYINIVLGAIAETLAYIYSSLLITRLQRRISMLVLAFLLTMCNFSFFFIKIPENCLNETCNEKIMQSLIAFLARFLICCYYCFFYVYLEEILPTSVKNVGIALVKVFGMFGAILGPFVLEFAVHVNVNGTVLLGLASFLLCLFNFLTKESIGNKIPDQIEELIANKEEEKTKNNEE